MNIINKWDLGSHYSLLEVQQIPKKQFLEHINTYLLNEFPALSWDKIIDEQSRPKAKELKSRLAEKYELRICIEHKGELVGWTYGFQDSLDFTRFYMAASLILPDHRKKGLYSHLLKKVIEITEDKGFTSIMSRHVISNNPVLIAKLKQGFKISGLEIDAKMGSLIKLNYYHSEALSRVAHFRSGAYRDKKALDLLLTNED